MPADFEPFAAPAPPGPRLDAANYKLIAALFVLFLGIVSDPFVSGVLAGFGPKAVHGRTPTAWGVVLQGVFLVFGYALFAYLTGSGIL